MKNGKALTAILLTGLLMKIFDFFGGVFFAQTYYDIGTDGYDSSSDAGHTDGCVPGYREYVAAFQAVHPEEEIRVGAEACVRYEEKDEEREPVIYTDHEGVSGDSIYTGSDSLTEFVVHVEQEGFYHMSLEYYPVEGSGVDIERSIMIDGELPYREMGRVRFGRVWGAEAEAPEWIVNDCSDSMGYVDEPLAVYLTEGEHRISLLALEEPMLIHQIVLYNEKPVREYTQVKAFWDAVGIKAAKGDPVRIEAEHPARTSSAQLHRAGNQEDSGAAAKQETGYIDGEDWKETGQWMEWEFDVEGVGYYHISLYDRQNYVKDTGVCRKIMIDGEIPFAEMDRYCFTYGRTWREDCCLMRQGYLMFSI